MMDGHGKSDGSSVPKKSPNKAAGKAAEGMEGREQAKGNSRGRDVVRTQSREAAHSAREWVRQAA